MSFPLVIVQPGLDIIRLTYRFQVSASLNWELIGRLMTWHWEHCAVNSLYLACISGGYAATSIASGPRSFGYGSFWAFSFSDMAPMAGPVAVITAARAAAPSTPIIQLLRIVSRLLACPGSKTSLN